VYGFVVHHQKERLAGVAVIEPVFGIFGNQVGYIPCMPGGILFGNELGVAVVALVVQYHPVVKAGGFGYEVPFADECGLVAIVAQYLGQGDLRAIEALVAVAHKSVFMAVLARKDGCAAGSRNGVTAVIVHKHGTFVPDAVYIGCGCYLSYGVPVDAHCLAGMVVAHYEEDVGLLPRLLLGNRCAEGQQGK